MHNQLTTEHPTSKSNPSQRSWAVALFLLTLVIVALRYAIPLKDGDIWFHILYGEYCWQNKTLIPDHTLYSWTPSINDNIYCTWLSDIFLSFYYKVSSIKGLFLLRYVCIYSLVLACFLFAKKMKIASRPETWLFCLLASLMSYTGIAAKSEIFTFVFMTLTTWNWWYIRTEKNSRVWKNCYLFPLMMLVWVNSHGGFIFGAIFLATIGIGEILNTWLSPANRLSPVVQKHLFIAALLTVFSLFITPYGFDYLYQIFLYFLPTQENITEVTRITAYKSPFANNDPMGLIMLLNISICSLVYLYSRNFRRIEWSSLLANLIFIFLYTRLLRTTFYWAPIFLFSSLTLLSDTQNASLPLSNRLSKLPSRLWPILIFSLAVWVSGMTMYKAISKPEMGCWTGFGIAESSPVNESKYIKKHFPTAKVGNTYNQGAYLMWELWPTNKVFIDSRHFPYREWLDEYWHYFNTDTIRRQPKQFADYITRQDCDIWLIGHEDMVIGQWFYLSSKWKLVYYGKNASVFLRQDIQYPEHLDDTEIHQGIRHIKNFIYASQALKWTLIIQDWTAAEIILNDMKERFVFPQQREKIRKLDHLVQLLKQKNTGLILH
ncbi:MAG: hypothetical protein QTN59_05540 [Candidatus Electrothrix communis]|nr:MAG: hypothetical protein QTN59_05540 [Candidatus Electrothrix communis]